MITLTGGHVQNIDSSALPKGSITFQLNVDATVVAAPGGLIPAAQVLVFQFDASGNIQSNARLYSNAELNPQIASGLGTYYLVSLYNANGALLNKAPLFWQFIEGSGSTVDISQMVAFLTNGNIIYYPIPLGSGTVTSVAMTGDGVIFNSVVSGSPITVSGTLIPALLTQTANTALMGPASGPNATPAFRSIVVADLPTSGIWAFAGTISGNLTFSGTPIFNNVPTFPSASGNLVLATPNGSSGSPSFRSLVNADFPTSGVSAGSYTNANITVNAQGIVTAASNGSGGGGSIGGVNSQTANYLAVSGDNGKLIVMNGSNITLQLPASVPSSTWMVFVTNLNATSLTIDPNGLTLDGSSSKISLEFLQGMLIFSDGSNYKSSRGVSQINFVDTPPSTVPAENEEFNSSVLNSKWTVNSNTVSTLSLNSQIPSAVWAKTGTSSTASYAITESVASGSGNIAFTAHVGSASGVNFQGVAIDLYDSNAIGTNTLEIQAGFNSGMKVQCFKYVSNVQTSLGASGVLPQPTPGLYIHLQRKSTTVAAFYSYTGADWFQLFSSTTTGFNSIVFSQFRLTLFNNGATTSTTMWCDWVRRDWIDLL